MLDTSKDYIGTEVPQKLLTRKNVVSRAMDLMVEDGFRLDQLILEKDQIPNYILTAQLDTYSSNANEDYGIENIDVDRELESLDCFVHTIDQLLESFQPQRLDVNYFKSHYQKLVANIKLLRTNPDSELIYQIRCEIKNEAIRTMLSLMLKHIPRFYREIGNGNIVIDSNSSTWSPDYYRMDEAEVENILLKFLSGKSILDPFGGAGAMTSVITAHGIPRSVVYGDLSYSGGIGIKDQPYNYDPILNISMLEEMFRGLPNYYRPELDRVLGFMTSNATALPFADNTFDYIFGDPPYGRTLRNGGVSFFMTFIEELLRVSKEGGIFMVPLEWVEDLNKSGLKYEQLTDDPSYGGSGYPICYILVPKNI